MFAKVKTWLRRAADADGGATALELALVLPIFIALLFGIFSFGVAQHKLSSIRYAMTTASRALMLNPTLTQGQVEEMVKAKLGDLADPNVTITLAITETAAGRVAHLTGVYSTEVGVPTVATYPIHYQTAIHTVLPAS